MTVDKPLDIVTDWFSRFVAIWKDSDVTDVFLDDAGWREHLVFDWDYRCLEGVERIRSYLRDDTVDGQPRMMAAVPHGDSLEVSMGPGNAPHVFAAGSGTSSAPSHRFASKLGLSLPAPAMADAPFTTTPEVTAHFRFLVGREGELSCGTVLAIVRLQQVEGAGFWRAKTFFTTWDPHAMSGKLALDCPFVLAEASEQERREWVALCETKPEVVIVGGGHSGLTLAVALTERKITNLVIEAAPSVGWIWAARYPGLHFHGPRWCHSLLNHEFAKGDMEEWVTKETFARKLEEYKDSFGIVVRTNTRLIEGGALWMPDQGSWRLHLEGSKDGRATTMNAAHVAFCVGPLNTLKPRMPHFVQSSAHPFKGHILNTETFAKAMQPQLYDLDDAPLDVEGKRFVVVGHASSGADIASYLTNNGASVTVMARKPQLVQSYDFISMLMSKIYPEGTGRALPDCDVTFRATPYKYMLGLEPKRVEFMDKVVDKDLHDALRAKGVPVWFGENDGGFSAEARKHGGTHLFDPGLKDPVFKGLAYHVVHGNLDYRSGVTVRELRDNHVVMSNGDEIEADAVIFSIGYELGGPNVHRFLRRADGSHMADNDQILHSFPVNEEGEFTGIFRPIDLQEDGGPNSRLWLASMGVPHSRSYLPLLAMQIQRASLLSAQPVA